MAQLSFQSLSLIGFGLLLLTSLIRRYLTYRRLKHIPGPPLAGFTSFWIFKQIFQARSNAAQFEALAKYGTPARLGPTLVTTNDPDLIRHMSAPRSKWTRSTWYSGMKLDPRTDSVFSTRDEGVHAQLKAMEIGAYNGRDVDTLEEDVDENIVKLLDLIRRKYQGKIMDLADISSWFTLDVLSKIAFGESFGFMAANRDLWDYNKINGQFFRPLEAILTIPALRSIFQTPWVANLVSPKTTEPNGQGAVYGFAHERISARYAEAAEKGSERKDMLGYFISKGLTQVQTEAEARVQVIAGSDSTASNIRNTMMLLISHPVTYFKLRSEIDEAVKAGNISFPVPTHAEASKLEYLQAVIWEGCRMYPPLFGLLSKIPPPGGETFKGVFYPEGTEVAYCHDSVARRPDVYGPDVDKFRPERYLESDPELNALRFRNTDLMFGAGKYGCLGKYIGLMELGKVFVVLMRDFDWANPDPFRGSSMKAQGIWVQEGINVIATPREL